MLAQGSCTHTYPWFEALYLIVDGIHYQGDIASSPISLAHASTVSAIERAIGVAAVLFGITYVVEVYAIDIIAGDNLFDQCTEVLNSTGV